MRENVLRRSVFQRASARQNGIPRDLSSSHSGRFNRFLHLISESNGRSSHHSMFLLLNEGVVRIMSQCPIGLNSNRFPASVRTSGGLRSMLFRAKVLRRNNSRTASARRRYFVLHHGAWRVLRRVRRHTSFVTSAYLP